MDFKIPIVDFTSFSSIACDLFSSEMIEAQQETARKVDEANQKHGFVCLRNSGINQSTLKHAFQASKGLFDLPESDKVKLKKLDPKTNTGYTGYSQESLNRKRQPDMKEAFNVRNTSLELKTNIDLKNTPKQFKNDVGDFWKELNTLGNQYSRCCSLALGLDDDYFSRTLNTMDLCTLRMLHYPPVCGGDDTGGNITLNSSSAIRVGEHTDFGIFTFLFIHEFHQESSHGLQVKAIEGADLAEKDDSFVGTGWNDVVFDNETLNELSNDSTATVIVNTGALMARWTNDVWRATAHRVIVTPSAVSNHRYSMAMFFDPDKETICSVHPKFVKDKGKPKYPPIRSIDYLLMKLKEAQQG